LFPFPLRLALLAAVSVMICLFIILLYRCFDAFGRKQLIVSSIVMFAIMASIFAAVMINFRPALMTDSLNLWDTGKYFAKTGKWPMQLSAPHYRYFEMYANNYFLVICYTFFLKMLHIAGIWDDSLPLLLLAAGSLLVSTVFMWMIGLKTGGLRTAAKLLSLCVMNPVYYILALWPYTAVFSIPFTMAVFYFGICIYQERRTSRLCFACIMLAVCSVAGYFIRPTAVIPLIAFMICGILWTLGNKEKARKLLKCAVLCILAGCVLFSAISALNDSFFGTVSDGNYPITHWLMMAAHGNGTVSAEDNAFTGQFETKEEKTEATIAKIKEYYSEYSLPELIRFLYKKLVISWGHADGGDLLEKVSQDNKMTSLYSWILGDRPDVFKLCCFGFRLAILFLMLVSICTLLAGRSKEPYQFVFILSLLGCILFYCIWEVKATYTLPFVYIMLLVSARGADVLAKKLASAENGTGLRPGRRLLPYAVLACVLCICLMSYEKMTNTEVGRKEWSVRCIRTLSVGRYDVGKGELLNISQEFYASRPFNRIALLGASDTEARTLGAGYSIRLLDQDGEELYSGEIQASELVRKEYTYFNIGEIVPDGREKYVLQISEKEGNNGKMYFKRMTGSYLDIYDGETIVNGKNSPFDLCMQVFEEYTDKWCPKTMGALLNGGLFTVALLLYLWLKNEKGMNRWIKRRCEGK